MDRTERLLDLVALFLDARRPLSWPQLKEAFKADYGTGAAEACERKWERDKAELLELGLPLKFEPATDESPEGYVVDKASYYLPEVPLSADEWALLYTAGSAALASGAFPGSNDLAHALRKLGFFSKAPLPAPKVRLELGDRAAKELPARLDTLWSAIGARKAVTLDYRSPRAPGVTRRTVDGYGLSLRRGVWNFVGFCHLRQEVRTFLVHRMDAVVVNAAKPKSPDYEVPASFSLDDAVAVWPWQHRFHPPMRVEVELSGSLTALASTLFPSPPTPSAQGLRVAVDATDLEGLLRYVLSLGAEARVVSPDAAVAQAKAMVTRVLNAHGSAS